MTIARLPDWEQRLAAYLDEVRTTPFRYGRHDCALYAAGAVLAMTGSDLADAYRGRYRSVAGSIRLLRTQGQGTLEATVDALFTERAVGFARRGDLAMHGGSLGVVIGADAMFITETQADDHRVVGQGLERVPRALWDKAWAVG